MAFDQWNNILDCFFKNVSAMQDKKDLDGGSAMEIFVIIPTVPLVSVLLYGILDLSVSSKKKNIIHAYALNTFWLLILTIWSDYVGLIFSGVMASFTLMFIAIIYTVDWDGGSESRVKLSWSKTASEIWKSFSHSEVLNVSSSLPYLTAYRSHILSGTVISILAVDFLVYPSRFSKTETYGWSVMDIGVGQFVMIHGMCAPEAKGKYSGSFKKSVMSSLPLLLLGFMRLVAVTSVDYHLSISEYGVHWNFFFTLGLTKILCCCLLSVIPSATNLYFTVTFGLLHQWLLSGYGLTNFILSDDRNNILEANKEGIHSLPGFMFIYFIGIELGKYLYKPRFKTKDYVTLLFEISILGICMWMGMMMLHSNVQPVSRRMCNLAYCIWMVCVACFEIVIQLVVYICLMVYQKYKDLMNGIRNNKVKCPQIYFWEALNFNGLIYFLIGNVFTGLVNMSIKTSESSDAIAMIILFMYASILCTISILLKQWQIRVKL